MVELDDLFGRKRRGDNQRAVFTDEFVNWLEPGPTPRSHALTQHIVHRDRDVGDARLILGHAQLELFLVWSDNRKVLRRDAVSLRGVTVSAKCRADFAFLARGED